ncbi:hypothetical protein [Bremerella cremea]|uniref:hypothetical protein n=1 Tax=Bremerella cremea TaxID=1031537 RepID=UPI001314279A|nr:hypothetical protein [Bremerella cremea]
MLESLQLADHWAGILRGDRSPDRVHPPFAWYGDTSPTIAKEVSSELFRSADV